MSGNCEGCGKPLVDEFSTVTLSTVAYGPTGVETIQEHWHNNCARLVTPEDFAKYRRPNA